MRKLLLATSALLALTSVSKADIIVDDPLHGQCTPACPEVNFGANGMHTPIASNPPVGWSFSISPGPQTGTQYIDFLVPDVSVPAGGLMNPGVNISLHSDMTHATIATATLFSLTPWTGGFLDSYLGISASPANPLDAYLPETLALLGAAGAGVNGYYVFQASLGTQTVPPNGGPFTYYDANKGALGMYIVSFLNNNGFIATANSGALLETGSGNTINPLTPPVPELSTWAMMLLGFAGVGFMAYRRKSQGHFRFV